MEDRDILLQYIQQYADADIMLAFSGGVDSGLLLKICTDVLSETGHKVYAVTFSTTMHPMGDIKIAKEAAHKAGAEHIIIEVDELEKAGIEYNPEDRCYRCKKYLFSQLLEKAKELGVATVMEGSNEDDLHVYRPGLRAVKELGIISPLAACHITKASVRKMAAELGLAEAKRPSSPCMATRFPYGTRLDNELMHKADLIETCIKSYYIGNVRARIHDDIVRIEADDKDFTKIIKNKAAITSYIKGLGFQYITLDLSGFVSGSMDYKVIQGKNT